MNKLLTIFILITSTISCVSYNKTDLEKSLEFAGNNREQLEEVLKHYSFYEKDSLKYKAACFLIENMRYYYSFKSQKLELFKSNIYLLSIKNNWSPKEALNYLEKKYGKLNPCEMEKIYDIHIITSNYLIQNIDQAFSAWENAAWRERSTFKEFCEEILPYRIGDEPLEDWRNNYLKRFKIIVDSFKYKTDPVKVYTMLIDTILKSKWCFNQDLQLPHLGANILLDNHYGYCRDMCDLGVYIIRSLGMPGGTDMLVQHADDNYGEHMWNYIRDSIGRTIEIDMINEKDKILRVRKKGRVYRICHSVQKRNNSSLYPLNKDVPKWLYSPFIKDVSNLYFPSNKIIIPLSGKGGNQSKIYLGVFNNKNWIPVTLKKKCNNQVVFENLDTTVMYMPLYYSYGEFKPFDNVFNIKSDNSIIHPKANYKILSNMLLLRKHRIPHWWTIFGHRSWHGCFQGANKLDFSDTTNLHIIDYPLKMDYYRINVKSKKKFKYIRYMSGIDGYNNMAEISFWNSNNNQKLTGKIIGTEGSSKNILERTKKAVFDNDPITFYDANEENGSWVGLEFEIPQEVEIIQFLFRNDDNNIRIGDEYELLYLGDNCKWKSMGKRIATNIKLNYRNVPTNALYLLRNHTRGREERIFTYENNEQIWW